MDQNSQGLHEVGQEEANDEESAAVLINEYTYTHGGKYPPQLHREKHALLWHCLPAPLRWSEGSDGRCNRRVVLETVNYLFVILEADHTEINLRSVKGLVAGREPFLEKRY